MNPTPLFLGSQRSLDGRAPAPFALPARHLLTHAVVTGMTGSGKTGLLLVLAEEALRARVPVVLIDSKGDLANLLLAFPEHTPDAYAPWLQDPSSAALVAHARRTALAETGLSLAEVSRFKHSAQVRVLTPGSTVAEPLHLLSGLEVRSAHWDGDLETARSSLAHAVSLVLRLVNRDPDPARSREHVLLAVLAERRLLAGAGAPLEALIDDLEDPPMQTIGALTVDAFVSPAERRSLAAALNSLLASPSFSAWRTGAPLDPGAWLAHPEHDEDPVSATVLSLAHLSDEERTLVLSLVLAELHEHVRSLPGAHELRALVVLDEVYGLLPPHPANPPSKKPIVGLLKQARAFGVGLVLATQNPMDLDYRALSNAGLWFVGRLQTDADRARVIESMAGEESSPRATRASALAKTVKQLAPRWFVVRDAHDGETLALLHPRETMSWLKGPLTRDELARVAPKREWARQGVPASNNASVARASTAERAP